MPTRLDGDRPGRDDNHGVFGMPGTADDQVPLNYEYRNYTRGFGDGLSRIDEESSRPSTAAPGSNRNAFI